MNKRLFFIILFFMINLLSLYCITSIDEYLLITFKGSIDKYPITMHMKIENPDSIEEGKSTLITGHYKYDKINTPIKLEGIISSRGITINANDDEVFIFYFKENQLDNIIYSKRESYINLNGKWRNNNKYLECNIRTSKLVHSIYEIYIEKEYKGNRGGIGGIYIEDASMGTFSYLKGEMKNTTLYQLIEEMDKYLDDCIQTDEYVLEFDEYVNIFDYFDERIFTLRFVFSGYYGGFSTVAGSMNVIISLDTLETIDNSLLSLVYDSVEVKNMLKRKLKALNPDSYDEDDAGKLVDGTDLLYSEVCFNTDATVTINLYFPKSISHYSFIDINKYELEPYVKKDSFYRYLFIK